MYSVWGIELKKKLQFFLVTLKVGHFAGQLQMAVDDVEQLLRRWNASGVEFRPNGHIVERDLERTG